MSTREQTLKQAIQENLQAFNSGSLTDCGLALFQTLGYRVDKRSESDDSPTTFLEQFNGEGLLNLDKALVGDWDTIDLLFQLTKDEIIGGNQIRIDFGNNNRLDNTVIESYLFFAVRLNGSSLQERARELYSRKDLATITREINKLFPMPVMLLFQHEQTVTLSVINRRLNKRDESRDVLEKVTLIKDIAVVSPHRAHTEILFDLSLEQLYKAHKFSNFVELHRAWQKTLDSSELNKRFFKEVADWYFWATRQVVFPADAPKDEEGQDSISVIRMITRLIFVWFLKEKGLVPEELFYRSHIENLIDFDDPNSSSYYKAILQNLFFATLNQPMNRDKSGSRKFRSEGKGNSRDGHYMIHNVYRYRALMKQPDAVEQLLAEVPFLNGGLFECLDQTTDNKYPIRIDGFSDRADNALSVPNSLFFAPEQDIDLNDIYGTKNKRYKVYGLIDILNRYKFTITENTPIEEEIALDPELLGKVFENLLASYNQETRVTARKQTGSFYTPREVVDYMVDESLMVYLTNALIPQPLPQEKGSRSQSPSPRAEEGFGVRADLETDLRILLNYGNADNPFADRPEERLLLIVAIDQLKMLDPAVGSGAFPMGILQKLVFILGKLDPDNELWRYQQKEREIQRVREDIQQAQKISYEEARDAAIIQLEDRLKEIEDDFENNEMDYPRKLFLIENCIYGVDIQPIAVQIAKLRFFISLVVEQKVTEQLPNRGVLPLPNLETKFVAANTLMGIDRQMNLRSEAVIVREAELGTVRRKHFMARTPQTKQKYRLQDSALRQEICTLLQETGLESATAETLAQWNPYDQNASAPFFDPEWMFGIQTGFDMVIGNPPYIFARSSQDKGLSQQEKKYFSKNYELIEFQINLYSLFIEQGYRFLHPSGILSYITPNNWLTINTNKKLRKFILQQSNIKIVNFYAQVFESASVDSAIVICSKGSHRRYIDFLEYTDCFNSLYKGSPDFFLKRRDYIINIEVVKGNEGSLIVEKIESQSLELKQIATIKAGLKVYEVGAGKPPQTQDIRDQRRFHSQEKVDETYFKYVDGRDVCRYYLTWGGEFLMYGKHLSRPRVFDLFERKRILVRQIPSTPPYCINACLTKEIFLNDLNSMNILIDENAESVLAILNSKLISYWFRNKFGKMQRVTFPQFKVNELATFPIPINLEGYKEILTQKVHEIMLTKAKNPISDTSKLDEEIDQTIYKIYGLTEEEIATIEE
jgi:adenine-specific DNA-methyltransferase